MAGLVLLLVGVFATNAAKPVRWARPASLVGLVMALAPLGVGAMANNSSFLGKPVVVDRDRAVEVVSEAKDAGVSDFPCPAARDRHQGKEIKSLAGTSD